MKNILGEEVKPKPLTIKVTEAHGFKFLWLYHGKNYVGHVLSNGWTGKTVIINYPVGTPVLVDIKGDLSLGEMQQIIDKWKEVNELS